MAGSFHGPIEHIVVLMLENRSFDHLFGFRPHVNGLAGSESNLLRASKPQSGDNPAFVVKQPASYAISHGEGPSHSLNAVNVQIFDNKNGPAHGFPARNNGFAENYYGSLTQAVRQPPAELVADVMGVFSADQLPTINALADQFVLCDNWYCEVPGPTMPNRMFIHAATSGGYAHNVWNHVFDDRTIYGSVQDAGLSWATYEFDNNEVRQFSTVSGQTANFKNFESDFAQDASQGRLPNYSFIVPRFFNAHGKLVNSQHAPWDLRPGEDLIADTYEALAANPAVWNKTALVVTYDEHGGFYDHVVPPATGVPNPDGISSPPHGDASFAPKFGFDRLGLRVPAIIASPWVAKGKVDSTRYQHTSVLATAKEMFGLADFLTKRDASANHFAGMFDELSAPRTDTPSKLPRPASTESILESTAAGISPDDAPLDSLQKEMLIGALQLTAGFSRAASEAPFSVPETQGAAAALLKQRIAERFGGK